MGNRPAPRCRERPGDGLLTLDVDFPRKRQRQFVRHAFLRSAIVAYIEQKRNTPRDLPADTGITRWVKCIVRVPKT